ncbi:hypothetical protein Mapa_011314 [Marchantia paleacea]|nr:hypothetical protein Mapa_011314 [Marchantia paleacea]
MEDWGSATSQLQPTNKRSHSALEPAIGRNIPHQRSTSQSHVIWMFSTRPAMQCIRALITTPLTTTSISTSSPYVPLFSCPCLLSRNICPARMIFSPSLSPLGKMKSKANDSWPRLRRTSNHGHKAMTLSPIFSST